MKKVRRMFALLLTMMIVFGMAGQASAARHVSSGTTEDGRIQVTFEFNDSREAEWAIEYIAKMQSMDVFRGFEDGTFRPNQPVKRIEAIVTAVRLMGLEEEAKAKSGDSKLHFKDAKLVDQKFAWAKGYVLVALENGLFDASEDKIQPDKPASRVWTSSLLVRALGLEDEALKRMTDVPEFKDAAGIAAGAIGYVNVAVDRGIVTGYPDNTFKPEKKVTRAEMAALLERTNEGLLENDGAVTVTGKITAVGFAETVGQETQTNGSVTIQSFNGDSLTYGISSTLLVKYGKRFIPANQLWLDDLVSLTVKDNLVVEAALLKKEIAGEPTAGIREFKLEAKVDEHQEYTMKYKYKEGKKIAEFKNEIDGSEEKLSGEEAAAAIESFLTELQLTPEMSRDEITAVVLSALELKVENIGKLELKINFSNGKKLEIKQESEDENADENEDDENEEEED